jgi:hypothetical protein
MLGMEERQAPITGEGPLAGKGPDRDGHRAALERRELQFRTLAENAPDLILRLDTDLRVLYMNPAAREIVPVARDAIGRTLEAVGSTDDPSTGEHHVHLCLDGADCDVESEYSLVYGDTFEIDAGGTRVTTSSKPSIAAATSSAHCWSRRWDPGSTRTTRPSGMPNSSTASSPSVGTSTTASHDPAAMASLTSANASDAAATPRLASACPRTRPPAGSNGCSGSATGNTRSRANVAPETTSGTREGNAGGFACRATSARLPNCRSLVKQAFP